MIVLFAITGAVMAILLLVLAGLIGLLAISRLPLREGQP